MAFLFLTENEITKTTVLGGNVDKDRYRFFIEDAQETTIQNLLGTELYDKIYDDAENDVLAGDYLTLYTEYVKPITKNEALAKYLEVAQLTVGNGGIFKKISENGEQASEAEVTALANLYHSKADTYILRFKDWICLNPLTEYKTSQDGIDAQDITRTGGWWFPS